MKKLTLYSVVQVYDAYTFETRGYFALKKEAEEYIRQNTWDPDEFFEIEELSVSQILDIYDGEFETAMDIFREIENKGYYEIQNTHRQKTIPNF